MSLPDIPSYQEQIETLQSSYQSMLDSEMKQDEQLLQGYADQLKVIQQIYQKLPATLTRPDTIPAIFNSAYDENFISDYLAYVLNPDKNGLGTEPLRALLGLVSAEFNGIDIQEVDLYREYTLDSGRIDLLIIIDESLVVGIENKILSDESDNQTEYYARVISKDFTEYQKAMIFLSPHGTQPISKYFRAISYKQLLNTFRCMPYDWITDVKKSVLWEDFLQHLEEYIVSEKTSFEFSPRAELYLENYKMVSDLTQAFKDDWVRLLDFIEAKLKSHIQGGDWETKFNKSRYFWHIATKKSWQQSNLWIHYEYFFDAERLSSGQLDFMFDIEGNESNNFLGLFDNKYPILIDEYNARTIEYRPKHRKHAIAWKTYNFDTPYVKWDELFVDAFDEFAYLTPHIEEVLAEYRASLDTSK